MATLTPPELLERETELASIDAGLHAAQDGEGRLLVIEGPAEFATGESVRYTLDFTDVGTEVSYTLYGARSGTASAHGTFLTQRTSPDVVEQCGGDGAK